MTSRSPSLRQNRSGFTLIEVSLAVMVLGLGLMAAFGLFPAGVRQNEESTADTRAALFADYVLNGMQANAAAVTNWSDWYNESTTYSHFLGTASDMPCPNADASDSPGLAGVQATGAPLSVPDWPLSSGQKLRYRLTMTPDDGNRVYTAMLEVKDLDDGSDFNPPDGVFYTAFIFKGM